MSFGDDLKSNQEKREEKNEENEKENIIIESILENWSLLRRYRKEFGKQIEEHTPKSGVDEYCGRVRKCSTPNALEDHLIGYEVQIRA